MSSDRATAKRLGAMTHEAVMAECLRKNSEIRILQTEVQLLRASNAELSIKIDKVIGINASILMDAEKVHKTLVN